MKPKHTPGPWEVTEAHDGTLQPFQAATGRHLLSCEGENPLPREQREHNAAVIGQADRMLALLKEAHQQIFTLVPEIFDNAEHQADWSKQLKLLSDIEDTIYKAEHP